MADPTQTNISNTTIPDYAKPYVETMLGQTQALTDINQNPYKPYPGQRTAGFTDMQNQAFGAAGQLGPAGQLGTATDLAQRAGLGALSTQYAPSQYTNRFTYSPEDVQGAQAQAAQTGYMPALQNYQMGPAQRVGTQQFTGNQVSQYMNPYLQAALDPQLAEIKRQYDITGQQEQAAAVGRGAFGGSRQGLMQAENQRNKNLAMNQVIGQGYNQAYQNAAQQFNTQQQANLQAQLANQGAGLTTNQANLQALLGVQGLGAQYGSQMALANLGNQQQANLQNAQLAQQANLANQNVGLQTATTGAQYGLAANQLNEQSRQYGAGLGLQGLQTALQGAGALGNLGATQFGQQAQAIGLQGQMGGVQQQQQQNVLNQQYQDFLTQKQYPYTQLSYMSDMLRGLPLSQTSTAMYQNPSTLSQVAGLGTAAAGAYGMYKGLAGSTAAKGGSTKDIKKRPAGLAELALSKMA